MLTSPDNKAFPDSKNHYAVLDALRGVAAITVVIFHLLEIFSGGDHTKQWVNHGYLAVDFFFLLSGFVIAHAYDDRWHKMSLKDFFKRRLIRLHPMIIVGMLIGAICFYFSSSAMFPNVQQTPFWKLLVVTFFGMLLIPLPISMDIRGWTEMYPLNGPAWSLFFEYLANIFYALILRRVSKTIIIILVAIAALDLIQLAVTSPQGDIIGGWAIDPLQLRIGFTRLAYPFLAGLLLRRIFKTGNVKSTFLLCSVLLITALAIPRVGNTHLWVNGIYDSLTIILVFPLIVYLGASGYVKGKNATATCKFLGDISYPIYIIHFPIAYIYYTWVVNNNITVQQAWPTALMILIMSIILAYAFFKLYDVPVRKWLTRRYMTS